MHQSPRRGPVVFAVVLALMAVLVGLFNQPSEPTPERTIAGSSFVVDELEVVVEKVGEVKPFNATADVIVGEVPEYVIPIHLAIKNNSSWGKTLPLVDIAVIGEQGEFGQSSIVNVDWRGFDDSLGAGEQSSGVVWAGVPEGFEADAVRFEHVTITLE